MIYVAIAEAAALVALVVAFSGLSARMMRAHERERDRLLDKMMHLAGKTWTPAPADEKPVDPEPIRLLRNVDQMAPEDRL